MSKVLCSMTYIPSFIQHRPTGFVVQSKPLGPYYELTWQDDGTLYCPCRSYEFSPAPKTGKHADVAIKRAREGKKYVGELLADLRGEMCADGRVEHAVEFDGPMDFGGALVSIGTGKRVEKIGGIPL